MNCCIHKIIPLIFFAFSLISFDVSSQIHIAPPNGGDGLPGAVSRSFEIYWESIDSASYYEYIVSNNPACFEGCPGDTRQKKTLDTLGVEYNLQENTWYYWITRIYYENGDTSPWTFISSFLAISSEIIDKGQLAVFAPNPTFGDINIKLDWGVNPEAETITINLYSINGLKVGETVIIEKTGVSRYQKYLLPFSIPTEGVYIAEFVIDDNPNNPNNRIIKKIIVIQ
jgi:hypothetical protein